MFVISHNYKNKSFIWFCYNYVLLIYIFQEAFGNWHIIPKPKCIKVYTLVFTFLIIIHFTGVPQNKYIL